MQLLYVTQYFPVLSQTFVIDEIRNHLAAGVDVRVAVLTDAAAADFRLDASDPLTERTVYLGATLEQTLSAKARFVARGLWAAARSVRALAIARLIGEGLTLREALAAAMVTARFPAPTIVHCHFGNIGRTGLAVTRLARNQPLLFVTFHAFEMTSSWAQPLEQFYRPLFDSPARLLPISDYWRALLLRAGAHPDRAIKHHMGVAIPPAGRVEHEERGASGPLRIVATGRMVEKKGHAITVAALARLRALDPDLAFSCQIVGDGPEFGRLAAQIAALDLSHQVRLLGALPHRDTLALVAAADIFVLPSITAGDGDKEGIPVSLMEAMARGVPVISTRHSGIPELVEHEVTGLLTDERDVEALALAVRRLANDAPLRRRFGVGGTERVAAQFDQAKLGDMLRERYRKALAT